MVRGQGLRPVVAPLRCAQLKVIPSKRMTLAYKFQPSAGGFTASSSATGLSCLPLRPFLYVLSVRKSPLQESTRTGSPAAESGESLLEVILVSRIDSHSVPAKGLGDPQGRLPIESAARCFRNLLLVTTA